MSYPKTFYMKIQKKDDTLFKVNEETTIILDVPRSDIQYVNYSTLETLKDGIWSSGKYEGKQVRRKEKANVLVFANDLPKVKMLSIDRWKIYEIIDKDLVQINAEEQLQK